MKLCINCKHSVLKQNDTEHEFVRCSYNAQPSPVHGTVVVKDLPYCLVCRTSVNSLHCGMGAKFYEEKTDV